MSNVKELILQGKAVIGIELGSTRIKAVLIDEKHTPVASGSFDWENKLEHGIWTYSLDDIWAGLRGSYQELVKDVKAKYDVELTEVAAIGISAMMHGYMAFDKEEQLLVPFRTWRNTMTEQASEELTELFRYNIPQRWSIAHLYQAVLNGEEHVKDITYLTTLSGYLHWKLTGRKVLGIGDASGMFPIDMEKKDFDAVMLEKFQALPAVAGFSWKLSEILPQVLCAGEEAGVLTEEGAKLLDESGKLKAGCPLCPPEGDAGTGMVATNSVAQRTGNVSAGTSIFAMVVLEKALQNVYPQIDLVTTPDGSLVGMVHANNCTSDLNAWVGLFREFLESMGYKADMNQVFGTLYNKALEGDADCGGLLSYGFLSGEHIMGVSEGRPLFVRKPDSNFNLANFMRSHLFAALGTIRVGMEILKGEQVAIDSVLGHGGLFKTKGVGQQLMAAALEAPVSVMETAGEGGAWGIALLAAYMVRKEAGESLGDYLANKVFETAEISTIEPIAEDMAGFAAFVERFKAGVSMEQAAIDALR